MGIFLGTYFSKDLSNSFLPIGLIVIAVLFLLLAQKKDIYKQVDSRLHADEKVNAKADLLDVYIIVMLIGISIIVRAIGGSAISYDWQSIFIYGFLYTLSIVLGKALGGYFADKYGFLKVVLISLAGGLVCMLLGIKVSILAFIGIFLRR